MKKTMVYLPEDMHRFLTEEAERRGTSMAELVREAVAEYRTSSEAADSKSGLEALVGCLPSTGETTDIANNVDGVLADYFSPGGMWDQENYRDS